MMELATFVGFVIAGCAGAALVWRLVCTGRKVGRLERAVDRLEQALAQTSDCSIGMGRKVMSLERRMKLSERRQQEFEATDPGRLGYNEAIKLLALGADVEDLVTNCGLSRAEAELMAAIHSGQTTRDN